MPSKRGDGERCSVTTCRLGAVMRIRGVLREMALLCDSLYGRVDLVIVTMCTVCLYDVVLARVAVHDRYRYDKAEQLTATANPDPLASTSIPKPCNRVGGCGDGETSLPLITPYHPLNGW